MSKDWGLDLNLALWFPPISTKSHCAHRASEQTPSTSRPQTTYVLFYSNGYWLEVTICPNINFPWWIGVTNIRYSDDDIHNDDSILCYLHTCCDLWFETLFVGVLEWDKSMCNTCFHIVPLFSCVLLGYVWLLLIWSILISFGDAL